MAASKDLLKDIHILDIKIGKLEREMESYIMNKQSDLKNDLIEINEIVSLSKQLRIKEGQDLNQKLEKIKKSVATFCSSVRDVKPSPEFVEKVKLMMENIEMQMTEFKEGQRSSYEELLSTELTLWQECVLLEKKIDIWSSPVGQNEEDENDKKPIRRPPLSMERDILQNMPTEVAEFERFLDQTGGKRGGWSEEDHQTFLRIRQRFALQIKRQSQQRPNFTTTTTNEAGDNEEQQTAASARTAIDDFIHEVQRILVGKTIAIVREHELWYQEYLLLSDKKKEAIQRWKDRRKNERLRNVGDGESDNEEGANNQPDENKTAADWQKRRRAIEAKRTAVDAWRAQKEIERYREREKMAEDEKRLKEEKLNELQRQQEEKRKLVAQYKDEKEKRERERWMKEFEVQIKEKQEVQSQLQCHSARIQERNDRFILERLEKKKSAEEMEREKAERLERLKAKVQVNVTRDPNRLLQPTAGWQERLIAGEKERASDRSSGPVLSCQSIRNLPHRGVPAWRNNL